MSEYLLLYLFTRLDSVIVYIVCIGVVFLILSVGYLAQHDISKENISKEKRCFLWAKRWFVLSLLVFASAVFIPSQRDMAIIVGGKMALDIGRSEPVQELSRKIYVIVNKKLDEAAK